VVLEVSQVEVQDVMEVPVVVVTIIKVPEVQELQIKVTPGVVQAVRLMEEAVVEVLAVLAKMLMLTLIVGVMAVPE
tara:strand:- start:363 stop:590 length:228 start_codon:yes stop_codon:yes gene_type:complete